METAGLTGVLTALLLWGGEAKAQEQERSGEPVRPAQVDPWFGRDKALHFGASAGLAAAGYGVFSLAYDRPAQRLLGGGVFALGVGVVKELDDLAGNGQASFRDLTWDVLGTAAGLSVAWAVDRLVLRTARGVQVPSPQGLRRPAPVWGLGLSGRF